MRQVDFEHGSVGRNMLQSAVPMLVAQLFALLYNIVDRIFLGRIPGEGTMALAGVGLCFPRAKAPWRWPASGSASRWSS